MSAPAKSNPGAPRAVNGEARKSVSLSLNLSRAPRRRSREAAGRRAANQLGHRNQMEAHIEALEAEVAHLRQELATERDLHAAGILAFGDMCEKREAVEAARDHLRARLHQQIQQWHESAAGEVENSNTQYAQALDQCVADLLAVLTEPPPQSIRENGPINAIGPALDTKGEMP